jgi:NADH:ubiquinone oxidoreductase subunit 2 (subunit N)
LASLSKANDSSFFVFSTYKTETLLFLSLCVLLVLAALHVDIKKLVATSKFVIGLSALLEFITLRWGGLEHVVAFAESYKINSYTQSTKVLLLLVAVLLLNMFFMQNEQSYSLILCLHTLVFLSVILVSANNGFLLLITLENFSLLLYILTLKRKTHGGISAGVKYFVFGTLGSIIIF